MRTFTAALICFLLSIASTTFADEKKPQKMDREQKYREIATQIKLFGEIYRGVNQRYVDNIDPSDFIEAGIEGMLETLDPYTVYFKPDELDNLEMITKGKYGGVGIEIGTRGKDRELTVISPMEDTPAQRKGIRAGDVIIAVDGESTEGFTTQDASEVIRGEPGTDVVLTIRRSGFDKPLDYTLTRASIKIHDVAYSGIIDDKIAYVKLVRFSGNAGSELSEALDKVMQQNPRGLVLDLRSNPGGLLPSAVSVSEQFIEPGQSIVSTRGKISSSVREFNSSGNPTANKVPLVVLVNGGSASASEIVAGAIQDHDRGLILGTDTFGKGLVQSVMNLSSGAALKLTTARYYTPSGRLIQRELKQTESDEEIESLEAPPPASDSAKVIYLTDNGRQVFGGGGIAPDLEVEMPRMNQTIVEMYRRDLFFSFMDDFMNKNTAIDTVDVTEEMVSRFEEFIAEQEFTPQGDGDKEISALKEIAERDSLDEEFFAALERVEELLSDQRKLSDRDLRENIRQNLDREMASWLGGREWRIRSTFDEDVQLTEALKILSDSDLYNSLLQGTTRADLSK